MYFSIHQNGNSIMLVDRGGFGAAVLQVSAMGALHVLMFSDKMGGRSMPFNNI